MKRLSGTITKPDEFTDYLISQVVGIPSPAPEVPA